MIVNPYDYAFLFDKKTLPTDWELVKAAVSIANSYIETLLFDVEYGTTPAFLLAAEDNCKQCLLHEVDWHTLKNTIDLSALQIQQLDHKQNSLWGWSIWYAQKHKYLLLVCPQDGLTEQLLLQVFYLSGWLFERRERIQAERRLELKEQWIHDEIEDISRLQHLMLPDKSFTIPGVNIAYAYRALAGAGGDYLDVIDLSQDKEGGAHDVRAVIADVTGHGPSAAIETAMVDAILRTFTPSCDVKGPAQALNYLNQHFFTRKERGRFLTASIFRFLADREQLVYANAGHPPAYIKRGSTLMPLKEGGIPIGVLKENLWQSFQVDVVRGDILFMYSDVLIETRNTQGDYFGIEYLEKVLRQAPNEPAKLIAKVEQELMNFCQCKKYSDDMTLCAIQFSL